MDQKTFNRKSYSKIETSDHIYYPTCIFYKIQTNNTRPGILICVESKYDQKPPTSHKITLYTEPYNACSDIYFILVKSFYHGTLENLLLFFQLYHKDVLGKINKSSESQVDLLIYMLHGKYPRHLELRALI